MLATYAYDVHPRNESLKQWVESRWNARGEGGQPRTESVQSIRYPTRAWVLFTLVCPAILWRTANGPIVPTATRAETVITSEPELGVTQFMCGSAHIPVILIPCRCSFMLRKSHQTATSFYLLSDVALFDDRSVPADPKWRMFLWNRSTNSLHYCNHTTITVLLYPLFSRIYYRNCKLERLGSTFWVLSPQAQPQAQGC